MKIRLLTTIMLTLSVATTLASGPTPNNCEYYKQVNSEYKCRPKDYPLSFGYHLCQKYLRAQPQVSSNLNKWFPKIRFCLQDYLEKQRGFIRDCDELYTKALNSHIPCYKTTGFCKLDFADKISILKITSTDVLNSDIIAMGLNVQKACFASN
jgi:hypothetical protein